MKHKEVLELIEFASVASTHFVKSEIYLNDGSLTESQGETKKAQELMNSLLKDVFVEIKEDFEDINDVNDYDYPNVMELIKSLNDIAVYGARLLSLDFEEDSESMKQIVAKKLIVSVNTATEIYTALYLN